jgi:hypothetical protein
MLASLAFAGKILAAGAGFDVLFHKKATSRNLPLCYGLGWTVAVHGFCYDNAIISTL